jgi:hypothetical protein
MKKLNLNRVADDLEKISEINRIDEVITLLRQFKENNRFSGEIIDSEIAYLEEAQRFLIGEMVGAQETWT